MKNIIKSLLAAELFHVVLSFMMVSNDTTFWFNYGYCIPVVCVGLFVYWFSKLVVIVFKK